MSVQSSTSNTVFGAQLLRSSEVYKNYPWLTDILLGPGLLQENTARWLGQFQNTEGDIAEFCLVKHVYLLNFH
jgi:hypothetical protein